MDRLITVLSLSLVLNASSYAGNKNVITNRFFKILPESESHISHGLAHGREFKRDSIKALIWNIKKAGLYNWQTEFESFAKNQDLILIQEAYQTKRFINTTTAFSGVRWDMGISFLYKRYNNQATGTMIGSVVEPTEVTVKHTPDFEPVVRTPKAMTFAKYPIENKQNELLVISVHGINITSFRSFKRHMAQAETEISKHDGPVLFAGDFNTRTKQRTRHLMDLINKYGFKTVEFKNGHQRMRWKFTNNYLDHSFVKGLSIKHAEVIGDSKGSDHKPMLVELSID
jgi:endonuclease/exonuclease/phosphatase (EEP) superfamily protein YafD